MNLNKTFIAGNLTRDPELKQTTGGKSWCKVALALNEKGQDGQERVSFVDVLLFGKTAEAVANNLRKGSGMFVEGAIQQDRWEDKQTGQKRSAIVIRARYVQFIGKHGAKAETDQAQSSLQQHEVTPEEGLEPDDIAF